VVASGLPSLENTMSRLLSILAVCFLFLTAGLSTSCGGDDEADKGKKAEKAKKGKKGKKAEKAKAGKRGKKAGKKAGTIGKKAEKKAKKAEKRRTPKCNHKTYCQMDEDCVEVMKDFPADKFVCRDWCCKPTL
jgi:hypothetical protein